MRRPTLTTASIDLTLPPSPPTVAYTYDGLGRTLTIKMPDGSVTSYNYQGNVTTVTDPAGNWKQYINDAFGNLVTVLEPDPTQTGVTPWTPTQYPLSSAPTGSGELFTGYTYDALNHLTNVAMIRGTGTQDTHPVPHLRLQLEPVAAIGHQPGDGNRQLPVLSL